MLRPLSIDQKKQYVVSLVILAIVLLSFLFPSGTGRTVAAVLLVPSAVLASMLIRKRSILSLNKWQVVMLMSVIALLYVMLFYLTGLKFGFVYYIGLSWSSFIKFILPITASIVAIEMIRSVLLAQEGKGIYLISYVLCVAAEILALSNLKELHGFNAVMDMIGLTVFPAVVSNVLYHYVAKRYGAIPNIVYRLLISLYPYLIPVIPGTPDSLMSFVKLIVPILVYFFLYALYEKKRHYRSAQKTVWSYVGVAAGLILMISIAMLISNQFRFGMLVIATESMTGEVNKGDVVIYERYEDQSVSIGDVIVFEKNDVRIVHRVVDVERVNGINRYYTKGDANDSWDAGYVLDANIVGTTGLKIPYAGYPTIWVRDLFTQKVRGS